MKGIFFDCFILSQNYGKKRSVWKVLYITKPPNVKFPFQIIETSPMSDVLICWKRRNKGGGEEGGLHLCTNKAFRNVLASAQPWEECGD